MATFYVSSILGSDAFDGSTWLLAKATIAGALAVATTTGDKILAESTHAESLGATITWNVATSGIYVLIASVNRNGSTTTGHAGWLKGATVTISSNAFGTAIASTGAQTLYIYGFVFAGNSGSSASNVFTVCVTGEATIRNVTFDNCDISTPGSSATTLIGIGNGNASGQSMPMVTFKNTLLKGHNNTGGAVAQIRNVSMFSSGLTIAYNTAKPVALFDFVTGTTAQVEICDSDLSGYENSSGNLFSVTSFRHGFVSLRNCKLSANPSKTPTGTWQNNAVFIQYINVDSADTKTTLALYNRLGTMLSTEAIYRTTSPAAAIGSVPVGWQIVTTAACNEAEPFIATWFCNGFSTSTSSITATIKIIHDSATNLHDRNLWSDVEYVSSSTFPLGTLAGSRNAAPLDGSAVDWTSDSDTWVGTGGFGNPNKQKVLKTFTPSEGSAIMGRLSVGVASKTLYVDPQIIIS